MPIYIPDAGDLVWLDFDPWMGHEQSGRRPALVLTPASYNRKSGLALCCPLTTKIKNYPFEVVVTQDPPSAVLTDQVRSLDWRERHARLHSRAPATVLAEVRAKLHALVG